MSRLEKTLLIVVGAIVLAMYVAFTVVTMGGGDSAPVPPAAAADGPTASPWKELHRWEGERGPLRTELFTAPHYWRVVSNVPAALCDNHGTTILTMDAGEYGFVVDPGEYRLITETPGPYVVTVETR